MPSAVQRKGTESILVMPVEKRGSGQYGTESTELSKKNDLWNKVSAEGQELLDCPVRLSQGS